MAPGFEDWLDSLPVLERIGYRLDLKWAEVQPQVQPRREDPCQPRLLGGVSYTAGIICFICFLSALFIAKLYHDTSSPPCDLSANQDAMTALATLPYRSHKVRNSLTALTKKPTVVAWMTATPKGSQQQTGVLHRCATALSYMTFSSSQLLLHWPDRIDSPGTTLTALANDDGMVRGPDAQLRCDNRDNKLLVENPRHRLLTLSNNPWLAAIKNFTLTLTTTTTSITTTSTTTTSTRTSSGMEASRARLLEESCAPLQHLLDGELHGKVKAQLDRLRKDSEMVLAWLPAVEARWELVNTHATLLLLPSSSSSYDHSTTALMAATSTSIMQTRYALIVAAARKPWIWMCQWRGLLDAVEREGQEMGKLGRDAGTVWRSKLQFS